MSKKETKNKNRIVCIAIKCMNFFLKGYNDKNAQLFVDFIDFFCHTLVCNFENIFTSVTSIFYFQNGYVQKGAFNDIDRI